MWPSLLARTLVRGNLMLMIPTLILSIGLYLITDLFEKLDNFIEAEVGFTVVLTYFAVKVPLIISQLLPVIFLLAVVIQLCLMARSRELMALQAGGISLVRPARILIFCGIVCSFIQLGFSEFLGVMGERESTRIWAEEVRGRNISSAIFKDIWFTESRWMVSLGTLEPGNKGKRFTAYELEADGKTVRRFIEAESYTGRSGEWVLNKARESYPARYRSEEKETLILPLEQNPSMFRMFTRDVTPQQIPFWQLSKIIERLSLSGSNVEKLRTVFHSKIAYSCSLFVMALLGVALVTWTTNIYMATVLALIGTFIYYALFTVCTSMGESGVLPPVVAAWMANSIGMCFSGGRFLWIYFKK